MIEKQFIQHFSESEDALWLFNNHLRNSFLAYYFCD